MASALKYREILVNFEYEEPANPSNSNKPLKATDSANFQGNPHGK
jgi:hypothetical protein